MPTTACARARSAAMAASGSRGGTSARSRPAASARLSVSSASAPCGRTTSKPERAGVRQQRVPAVGRPALVGARARVHRDDVGPRRRARGRGRHVPAPARGAVDGVAERGPREAPAPRREMQVARHRVMDVVEDRDNGSRMLARSNPWRVPIAIRAITPPLTCSCSGGPRRSAPRAAWRGTRGTPRQVARASGERRQRRSASGTVRRTSPHIAGSAVNASSASQSTARPGRAAATSCAIASAQTTSPSDEGRTTRMPLMASFPGRTALRGAESEQRFIER